MVSLEQERTNRQSTLEAYQARVDACQKALIVARRKLETMEKIKTKLLSEHETKWSSEEQKELDEMMVRGRGSDLRVDYA